MDYGLADYTSSLMSNFLAAITIYFSVVTAYVVAAFAAGDRLTKLQLAIVNACYGIAAMIMGSLSVLIFDRFFSFAKQMGNPEDAIEPVDLTLPLGLLVLIIFAGSLTFMWSVRKKGG